MECLPQGFSAYSLGLDNSDVRALGAVGYLTAPLASIHWMPGASPTLSSCDNQRCFQTLPNASWEARPPLVENPWPPVTGRVIHYCLQSPLQLVGLMSTLQMRTPRLREGEGFAWGHVVISSRAENRSISVGNLENQLMKTWAQT